jgi:hypothetical protein
MYITTLLRMKARGELAETMKFLEEKANEYHNDCSLFCPEYYCCEAKTKEECEFNEP